MPISHALRLAPYLTIRFPQLCYFNIISDTLRFGTAIKITIQNIFVTTSGLEPQAKDLTSASVFFPETVCEKVCGK